MSAISWAGLETFSSPASTSTASSGDDWIRSFLTSVARGLGESFYWPGSAASAGASSGASSGELQLGTLRFSRYTSLTGGFNNGFLQLDPTRVAIWHSGSSWTGLLAHAAMLDRDGGLGNAPFTARWLVQEGTVDLSSSTTASVTFPTRYLGVPFVACSVQTGPGDAPNFGVNLLSVTSSGFSSVQSGVWLNAALVWRSEGTALL